MTKVLECAFVLELLRVVPGRNFVHCCSLTPPILFGQVMKFLQDNNTINLVKKKAVDAGK